jgi:anhydro-N-acetylmuramic acid kinase
MSTRLIAGAMSGTSADGVDVALVSIDGRGLDMTARLVHHHHEAYPPELRNAIFAIRERESVELPELARCARQISLSYASATRGALLGAGLGASDLIAIAAHGQTLFHDPPNTIQWIDPALLAHEVGCQVISDFRRADCAAGGQGAPLVPFADYLLFRHPTAHRVLLNIGGIANITILPAGASIDHLVAFDTGPGNCISDWICRTYDPQGPGCDLGGARALRGRMLREVKDQYLPDPYFACPPPKSTDGPAMVEIFQKALGKGRPEMNDLLATAAYLTGATIAGAVASQIPTNSAIELIASGGGIHNKAMMGHLSSLLPPGSVLCTTQDLGIPPEAKEAIAFALIGAATLDGVPANVPSCTGASRAVVLGSITP